MVRNVLIGAAAIAVPMAAVAGFVMKRGRHRSSGDRPMTADMEGPRDAYGVSAPVSATESQLDSVGRDGIPNPA